MTQTTLTGKPKATASKKRAKPDSDEEDDMSDGGQGSDNDDDDNDSAMSQTPPKKAKTAPAAKKGGSKPLADVKNESFGNEVASEGPKDTNVSEKYQKVSAIVPRLKC